MATGYSSVSKYGWKEGMSDFDKTVVIQPLLQKTRAPKEAGLTPEGVATSFLSVRTTASSISELPIQRG